MHFANICNLYSPSNSTLPGKKVKTYWVSLDGKTTDEIELTTGTKITDTDRVKILKGLRSVPKAVYDKCVLRYSDLAAVFIYSSPFFVSLVIKGESGSVHFPRWDGQACPQMTNQ